MKALDGNEYKINIDRTGIKYGRLTVTGLAGMDKGRHAVWRCECDCGEIRQVNGGSLASGHTRSCGCYHRERVTTHGLEGHPLYKVWHAMNRRGDKNNHHIPSYRRAGISVCTEWHWDTAGALHNFIAYVRDFLPEHPGKGWSLDRINNAGNYEPGNIQWATATDQQRNRCTNVILEFEGVSACLTAHAERVGIPRTTLHSRLSSGMSVEEALTRPVRQQKRKVVAC